MCRAVTVRFDMIRLNNADYTCCIIKCDPLGEVGEELERVWLCIAHILLTSSFCVKVQCMFSELGLMWLVRKRCFHTIHSHRHIDLEA